MDNHLITNSFLCPDSNRLLERTVLVIATDNGHFYVIRMTGNCYTDTSDQCALYIAPARA